MAHKVDLPEAKWKVGEDEGRRFAEEVGVGFVKAWAKTGVGLRNMTVEIVDGTVLNKIAAERESIGRSTFEDRFRGAYSQIDKKTVGQRIDPLPAQLGCAFAFTV